MMGKSDWERFQNILQFERSLTGSPAFADSPDERQVPIRASESVSRGNFKPDPLIPGGYIAHPVTIRAMKKDIFTTDEDIDLTARPTTCESCKALLDLQFWNFCPYCEASFPTRSS